MKLPLFYDDLDQFEEDAGRPAGHEFIRVNRERKGRFQIAVDAPTAKDKHKLVCALNALGLSLQRVAFDILSKETLYHGPYPGRTVNDADETN